MNLPHAPTLVLVNLGLVLANLVLLASNGFLFHQLRRANRELRDMIGMIHTYRTMMAVLCSKAWGMRGWPLMRITAQGGDDTEIVMDIRPKQFDRR